MRTSYLTALAALASVALVGTACAEDIIHVTPPLYREQAHAQAARLAVQPTTVPHPVAAAPAIPRIVAEAAPLR